MRTSGYGIESAVASILEREGDVEYLEAFEKWKKVRAAEVARFEEEARQAQATRDKADSWMYKN